MCVLCVWLKPPKKKKKIKTTQKGDIKGERERDAQLIYCDGGFGRSVQHQDGGMHSEGKRE